MMFCLDDGAELLYGPASAEGPSTAILRDTPGSGEAATRAQIYTTDQTAVLPSGMTEVPKPKSFDKRLVLVPLALAVMVLGGFFAIRHFNQAKQIDSIAVMPFVNESGNADVEYLSDGMTETLINSLSQIPNLSVKARSSVFRFKGKEIDPKEVAAELGVQAVLTGRLTQQGDRLSLSVELIDGRKENAIWGNKYERRSSDLVSLQSEVARDVLGKLKAQLSGEQISRVEKTYTADPEAYQLYLKGKFYWNNRTGDALKQAAEFYQRAIAKDPNYALAYSGLAETYVLFSSYGVASAPDSMPQAKAAAMRALAIDEQLAEAHTALAFYLSNFEWDRVGSEREYRRAIELKPDYSTAHHWLGADLTNVKRVDEAIAEMKRAEELDPLSAIIGTNIADTYRVMRRYDDAIAQYKRVLAREPNFSYAHLALGRAYGLKGMYPDAISETRRSIELNPDSSDKGWLGNLLGRSGMRDEALKVLTGLKEEVKKRYIPNDGFAVIHLALGNKQEALDYLEKHMLDHAETASAFGVDPELDDLRSEPRFREMLKRMNLPE
jgi:TolB-like protein/Tfp pilus assembly protein PilF